MKVTTRHKLIGSKVWVEAGEEVTEVEPEEEGFVTVQKDSGEQGSLPVFCLREGTVLFSSDKVHTNN